MTYNANLDKSLAQRKSPAELRAELRRWEELQTANAKKRERERGTVGEDAVRYQVCVPILPISGGFFAIGWELGVFFWLTRFMTESE